MLNKLPHGWVECQLGEVFEIVTGKTPPKKYPEYFNGDIPFVKPGDLDKEIYISQTKDDSLTAEGLKNAPNLPKNTVLVSCIGNLGKKAILGITGSCNQQINAIIPNDYIESKYTYFYIDKIVLWLEKNASATTVKILNKGKFEQAPFLLPPLNEQKRIVEKIESEFAKIDEGLEHLEKAKEQLKQYRQSVLKSALEGKLYKNTEWKEKSIEEITFKIIGGGTPSKSISQYYEGRIPFMTVKDMISSRPIDTEWHITQEAVEKSSTNIIPKDTIIIATRVGLGKIVRVDFATAINQDLKALILKESIDKNFCEYLIIYKTPEIVSKGRGTTVKGITLEELKNIKFNLPSLNEQKRIVEEIEKRFAVADEVEKVVEQNIEKAKQLKQSILKKAFEGRLVPQDPTDEPATKLLEKIKQERNKQNEFAR